ncbi:hypothetical protein COCNU_scaffold002674G000010 [Cocos nucifera]|nr:hypothetical protein [Cocos nucifera]
MEEGKKKKKAVTKMLCKAHLGEPSIDRDELGEDPSDDPKIVQDLTDKFAMLEVVDRMADLDPTSHLGFSWNHPQVGSPNARLHQDVTWSKSKSIDGPGGSSS